MAFLKLRELPPPLRERALPFLERLPEGLDLPEPVVESLPKVFALSRFVASQTVQHPDWLVWPGLLAPNRPFREALAEEILAAGDFEALCQRLRWARNREMVRIAWRDLAGWSGLEETLCDLTLLAETLVDLALSWLFERLGQRYGFPEGEGGAPQRLVVIGMGKLGGRELNFSSDIDLIFAYEREGKLRTLSYQEFYLKLAQNLIRVLSEKRAEGFVYRVDARLRPFGDSGPLVLNFDAMEEYYQAFGRDWERYAWIKGRPVAGDLEAGARLKGRLSPFVYRRYLDYSALEALRELKEKIAAEVRRRELSDDIKRGPGGIRELEFLVQLFQLIYGGREPRLQTESFLEALEALIELGHISPTEGAQIGEHYRFLRMVENHLQEESDQQTQRLPRDPSLRLGLALSLGFPAWEPFAEELQARRDWIQKRFETLLAAPSEEGSPLEALLFAEPPEEAKALLLELGLPSPEEALAAISAFRSSRRFRLIGPKGERALRRFFPRLLREVARMPEPLLSLRRLLALLETLAGRSVYYLLLAEQPQALHHLVSLSRSPLVLDLLARCPALLDELIDPRSLFHLPSRESLRLELENLLAGLSEEEELFEQLRLFKNAHLLRIAAAHLSGGLGTVEVEERLTWLAEVILEEALALTWHQAVDRYGLPPGSREKALCGGLAPGHPRGDPQGRAGAPRRPPLSGFAIIGYGKLGSRELGYTSDLDLVFLYQGDPNDQTSGPRPIPLQQFWTQLARRLIALLTLQTASGKVYEIDTQLRPSGRAGLLVSSFESYARYQREEAWTWEHQALIRARWVAGDAALKTPFEALREEILSRRREREGIAREFFEMREKMVTHLDRSRGERFDLKQGRGGLVDLQFVIEFETLSLAYRAPERFREGGLLPLIEALKEVGGLTPGEAERARRVGLAYHERLLECALQGRPPLVPLNEVAPLREVVLQLWEAHIGRYLTGLSSKRP